MRMRLAWALLAVSLALNLFFVGGVVYSKLQQPPGEDQASDARIAAITEKLGLSSAEREGLVALRASMRERWQAMRADRGGERGALLDALLDPALDRETARDLIRRRGASREQAMVDSMLDLHAYLAGLSDDQRHGFVAMAEDPGFFRELFGRPRPRPKD